MSGRSAADSRSVQRSRRTVAAIRRSNIGFDQSSSTSATSSSWSDRRRHLADGGSNLAEGGAEERKVALQVALLALRAFGGPLRPRRASISSARCSIGASYGPSLDFPHGPRDTAIRLQLARRAERCLEPGGRTQLPVRGDVPRRPADRWRHPRSRRSDPGECRSGRAAAGVAEGPHRRRLDVREHEARPARRGAQHRLRGGALPEHRRVLGARDRDVHDPRQRLHAELWILRDRHRSPADHRPGRAAARGRGREPMRLQHVVVTMVARDDLPDGGAGMVAETIRQIRLENPPARASRC